MNGDVSPSRIRRGFVWDSPGIWTVPADLKIMDAIMRMVYEGKAWLQSVLTTNSHRIHFATDRVPDFNWDISVNELISSKISTYQSNDINHMESNEFLSNKNSVLLAVAWLVTWWRDCLTSDHYRHNSILLVDLRWSVEWVNIYWKVINHKAKERSRQKTVRIMKKRYDNGNCDDYVWRSNTPSLNHEEYMKQVKNYFVAQNNVWTSEEQI